jgi:hypothetical protein
MPSSKKFKPPKSASSSLAGKSDTEKQKVNLLDSGAVKRELDEATIRVSFASFADGSLQLSLCCNDADMLAPRLSKMLVSRKITT